MILPSSERPGAGKRASPAAIGARLFLAFALMPAIILAFIAATIHTGISSYEAAHGHGTPGYFIAQGQNCSTMNGDTTCGWYGKFELPDGRVANQDASFDGSYPAMRAGARVPALAVGGTVYSRQGNLTWLGALIIGPLLTIVFVTWNVEVAGKAIRRVRASRA